MFRCAHFAMVLISLLDALPVALHQQWLASWRDVGEQYARDNPISVLDGVRTKITFDDGWAGDAPGRDVGGSAADVGGSGD